MSDLDDDELRATRKLNGVEWKEDINILETFRYRQKTKNYNKITLEDVREIEKLIARNKELESELNNSVSKDEIKEILKNKGGSSFIAKSDLQELLNKGES